jgi:DNA mismatch repair protein MutL
MSPRVKILPEQLTNKIAAGEVVERPASVVKELVENAIDAGCREVTVEIEAGGRRLIRVTDDGSGMSREDALLSLERHATSKIGSDSDLFNLSTLGFRGEALPSIASVSRLTLATREKERDEGTEIYIEGGRVRDVKSCGMAPGTVITVRNLFFNTPARLKFMKSQETETGHVGDLLTRLALSRPDIRFIYLNDGRTVFRLREGELAVRAAGLLGSALSRGLHPVDYTDGDLSVAGLVAAPETSRSASSHLYTYINGRFIRDKVVQHAVLQAYRNFLERGRFPVVALFITLPAGEVDVNVHPTKHEVRFREQGRVHDAIQSAVESVLRGTPWLRSTVPARSGAEPVGKTTEDARNAVREALAAYRPAQPSQQRFAPVPPVAARRSEVYQPVSVQQVCTEETVEPPVVVPSAPGYFSSLAVIGQFHAMYILCQDGDDLVLIDQHAAHERVAFERLKGQYLQGGVESQGLLFPESVEFSHSETAVLREHGATLHRIGFGIEHFGGSSWLLNALPRQLSGSDHLRLLRDILEELLSLGRSRGLDDILEELLTRIACHSVVRGIHPLSPAEIRELFRQMDATDFSTNCPHGRPVSRRITLAEIERMFKRG